MSLNKFTEAEELADNAMCARENPLSRAMKARCLVVFARARARDGRLSRAQSAVDEALRLDPNVEGASELRTKLLHLLAPSVAVTGDTKHIHKNSAAAAAVANVESADPRDRAIPAPRAPIAMSDLAVDASTSPGTAAATALTGTAVTTAALPGSAPTNGLSGTRTATSVMDKAAETATAILAASSGLMPANRPTAQSWTCEEVGQWLAGIAPLYGLYRALPAVHGFDGAVLMAVGAMQQDEALECLADLGIVEGKHPAAALHRKVIYHRIKLLHDPPRPSAHA